MKVLVRDFMEKEEINMPEDHDKSTEIDKEFDMIDELKTVLDDLYKKLGESKTQELPEKVSYLRFLVDDLDDVLSGEFEGLRRKRFIVKKTE